MKFVSFTGKMAGFAGKLLKWLALCAILFLVSLFFHEIRLPASFVQSVAEELSTPEVSVKCAGAGFGFKRGVTLHGLSVYDLTSTNATIPVAGASLVCIDPIRNIVTARDAFYSRLPDSYYGIAYAERSAPLNMELPNLPVFRLVLERPDILGLRPAKATAQVVVQKNLISFDEVHVEWPGKGKSVAEDGYFRIDLAEQRAHGEVRGFATQPHIRPLIEALDIPSALPYFDAFTEVPSPVTSAGEFDVNLVNNDFKMMLDLRPEMGRYNGVKMARAEGRLNLDVKTRGTNCFIRFGVTMPIAVDHSGRQLSGSFAVNLTNEYPRLDYNALSRLDLNDALAIADFIDPSVFDFVQCETAPEITIVGHSATCVEDSDWNDLGGSVRLLRGSVFGFKVHNLQLDYSLKRDVLELSNIRATGSGGGSAQGAVTVNMPDFDEDRMSFSAKASLTDGTIAEIAEIFDIDTAGKSGRLNGNVELFGPVCEDMHKRLSGKGHVTVDDGHLLQMKLFAGLTELLSNWVPGVGYIVNQSQGSIDFTLDNGVFSTENLYIEGGLMSLKGWGTYSIPEDSLDFTVRVQFMKNESLLGMIVHPVTWPFTKLLLEFKATGSLEAPHWDYISVIDRVL